MSKFQKGDRVYVDDPGLASLREVMRGILGKEPPPNHHGTVDDPEFGPGIVLIVFDDESGAPYGENETHLLETSDKGGKAT